jgi:hypothetical protein
MRRGEGVTKTVAVDFDGVLHAYSKGWHDGTIYDEPVSGAIDALHALMGTYAVFVHTTRPPLPVGNWLAERGFDVLAETMDLTSGRAHSRVTLAWGDRCEFWNRRDYLLVTNRKLPAVAYIDDRGIRFENWPQALADLERFEPAAGPPETGLDRVAAAVRKARGGDPPVQVQGFA